MLFIPLADLCKDWFKIKGMNFPYLTLMYQPQYWHYIFFFRSFFHCWILPPPSSHCERDQVRRPGLATARMLAFNGLPSTHSWSPTNELRGTSKRSTMTAEVGFARGERKVKSPSKDDEARTNECMNARECGLRLCRERLLRLDASLSLPTRPPPPPHHPLALVPPPDQWRWQMTDSGARRVFVRGSATRRRMGYLKCRSGGDKAIQHWR